jgi:hypothetical protein
LEGIEQLKMAKVDLTIGIWNLIDISTYK